MTELASLAQAASIFFACWAVISGVNAWKREFIGKRKIEIAELLLAKFFEVRDAIAFIRNPFCNSSEGKSRSKAEHESPDESKILDQAYVANERFLKKETVFSEFNTLKYRGMATFGNEIECVFVITSKVLRSILSSSMMLGTHYWQRQGRVSMEPEEFQRHLAEMQRHEKIFWDHGDETDEIRCELDNSQKLLEKILGPCFEEPMTLYTLLMMKLCRKDS